MVRPIYFATEYPVMYNKPKKQQDVKISCFWSSYSQQWITYMFAVTNVTVCLHKFTW